MKKILFFSLLSIAVIAAGCRAKMKTVDKLNEKEAITVEKIEKEKTVEKEATDSTTVKKTETTITEEGNTVTTENNKIAEVEADSSGVVEVEEIKTKTGKKTIYKGVKSIKLSDIQKKVQEEIKRQSVTIDSLATTLSSLKETTSEKIAELQAELEYEKSQRNTDSKTFGVPTWLWIVLLILGLFVLWQNRNVLALGVRKVYDRFKNTS